jgi:D-tyrosyl-tRNA(Tyr) deacylase
VTAASVEVDGEVVVSIGPGLCVLVGVTHGDDEPQADKLASRLWNLRIFEDDRGLMNKSAAELERPLLVVSQFTLYADTTRGRRPSFVAAAPPEMAEPLVSRLVESLRSQGADVATGRFRAEMAVALVNDGPVTVIVES